MKNIVLLVCLITTISLASSGESGGGDYWGAYAQASCSTADQVDSESYNSTTSRVIVSGSCDAYITILGSANTDCRARASVSNSWSVAFTGQGGTISLSRDSDVVGSPITGGTDSPVQGSGTRVVIPGVSIYAEASCETGASNPSAWAYGEGGLLW